MNIEKVLKILKIKKIVTFEQIEKAYRLQLKTCYTEKKLINLKKAVDRAYIEVLLDAMRWQLKIEKER